MDRDHFSNFSFPHPKEAPYEIWAKLAQRFQRRSRLKMLTDGRTDGHTDSRTDDGRKVITIAHTEQSSGELKMYNSTSKSDLKHLWILVLTRFSQEAPKMVTGKQITNSLTIFL